MQVCDGRGKMNSSIAIGALSPVGSIITRWWDVIALDDAENHPPRPGSILPAP